MAGKNCVFCGARGTSKEHAFAEWIADEIIGEGAFNLRRTGGARDKAGIKTLGVITRSACAPCNNGWMSFWETAARPLISPMIRGERTRLTSAGDQIAVARWAFKTGLMTDRSSAPPDVSPDEHCAHLYARGIPPSNVQISLGHYRPQPTDSEPIAAGFGAASLGDNDPGVPADLGGYRLLFSLGHVIFQIYGYAGTTRQDYELERQVTMVTATGDEVVVDDAFREIWPLSFKPFDWPPTGANFDTSGLRLLEPLP